MSRNSTSPCHLATGPQAGLTLIELLVAMVIGIFLVLGTLTVYV